MQTNMVSSLDKFTSIPFPVIWSTISFGIGGLYGLPDGGGWSEMKVRFYPSGIVVRRLHRHRRRIHSFGYYTNMVQQIKFIIHTNIQPLPALFFTQGQSKD